MEKKKLFEAFTIAIDRERQAQLFYSDLSEEVEEPELKQLFKELAETEIEHQHKLMQKYQEMLGESS
jgi:rubrerythrin